jgi:hypothetical protein
LVGRGELQGEVRGSQRQPHIFALVETLRVRRLPLDALHIKLKTLAEVATVLLPSGEQL